MQKYKNSQHREIVPLTGLLPNVAAKANVENNGSSNDEEIRHDDGKEIRNYSAKSNQQQRHKLKNIIGEPERDFRMVFAVLPPKESYDDGA